MRSLPRLAAGALLVSGCYHYVPSQGAPSATPGSEVRLYLSPEGTSRLAPVLGPETAIVGGRVTGAGDDGLRLVVSSTTKLHGGTIRWVGEPVTIPPGVVVRTERRTLDRRRSWLTGGAIVLATVAGFAALQSGQGEGSGEGGSGPGPSP